MKSISIKIICPDELDTEDIAQVLEGIDCFDFYDTSGGKFSVSLKHSLIEDKLFVIEKIQ